MNTDVKSGIYSLLTSGSALVTLLGGPRVYQLAAPKADEFPRITFFELDNVDSEWADDEPYASDVFVQIDVWSKGSTSAIAGEVDRLMKSAEWRRTAAPDFYEEDTKVYHKAMRYRISVLNNEGS